MNKVIIGAIVGAIVLLLWAGFTALGALLFMWAWNLLVPVLWHAAPHLGFWQAVAAGILIGTVKGVIQFTNTINKNKS